MRKQQAAVFGSLFGYVEQKAGRVFYPQSNWKKVYGVNALIMGVCKEVSDSAQEAAARYEVFQGADILRSCHKVGF